MVQLINCRSARLFVYVLLLLSSTNTFATATFVCDGSIRRNTFRMPTPLGKTPELGLWASRGGNLAAALPYANVVSRTQRRLQKRVGSAMAIRFSGADFANMARPGKSEATYVASDDEFSFEMNIGHADGDEAQTWTIPDELIEHLDEFTQRDFIRPASVPAGVRIDGATHATRYVAADGSYVGYRQYQLDNDEVEDLGFGIDLKEGDDYDVEFPTDGASLLPVPLELGSSYECHEIVDEPGSEDTKIETTSQIDFDGFGTLHTPDGDYPALRYTMTTHLSYDGPAADKAEDIRQVGWLTKEGHWFVATYSDYDEQTGKATLTDMAYTRIVPTSSLR